MHTKKERYDKIMEKSRTYVCIDLKSFYASVECVDRGLDPMRTNLVVADKERGDKTICLAISPSMKALGIKNRCRVFDIPKGVEYCMATPRMKRYIEVSAEIYAIYLRYIAKEDIHVYSIDEAFMDVTEYLVLYQMTARELGLKIMRDIKNSVGVDATCGIGSNLYLAKIALDIMAKHKQDGIGELDVESYRKELWDHKPLSDFWRVGAGTVKRLASIGITTMREVASADEAYLYQLFGVDARLLIDHAWGKEPTTIADIKAYKPKANCLSSGQVLMRDYSKEEAKLIVKEMADLLCLELVASNLVTDSITLSIAYANEYNKEASRGTIALNTASSSARVILSYMEKLYERIVNGTIPIRKVNITFNQVRKELYQQYDLFCDPVELEKERKLQQAMLDIKGKFGKNAILKGMNLQKGATTMERNRQIGGHKSGE